jgi:hypothetical protein
VFEPKMTQMLNENTPADQIAQEIDDAANALLTS